MYRVALLLNRVFIVPIPNTWSAGPTIGHTIIDPVLFIIGRVRFRYMGKTLVQHLLQVLHM